MLLAELPPDHLGLVINLLEGREIGSLWFCGDVKLNWKLSRGGAVKQFELSYSSQFGVVWPNLLAEFVFLESLNISTSYSRGNLLVFVPDYEKVSPCLKKLDLAFPFAISYLKQAQDKNGALFPNLEEFTYTNEYDDDHEIISVTKKWPKLSKLVIFDETKISPTDLPPTLTHIQVSGYLSDLTQLPSNLTSLDVIVDNCPDFFGSLPRSLELLDVSFHDSDDRSPVHLWKWSELPPNLTSLAMGCDFFTVDNAKSLPSGLRALRIYGFEVSYANRVEILKVLPKTLTKLLGFFDAPIDLDVARLLPPALKCDLFEDVEWNAVPHLPTALTTVRLLHHDDQVPAVERFPPSLQSLTTGVINETLAAQIPATLTSLTVTKGNMDLETVRRLPRNVQKLFTIQGQAFESIECLKYLPEKLSLMDVISLDLGSEQERHLPALLAVPESSSWLPRTLTHLSLGPLDLADSTWFSHLPPLLGTLKVCVDSLPPDSFLQLRKYKIKEPEIQARFTPSCGISHFITTLPRTLDKFTWNDITASYEGNWHRRVDTDILDQHLTNLPPWLCSLVIPKSNLNGSCGPHLPAYLGTLYCGDDQPEWFDLLVQHRKQLWSAERSTPLRSAE